ncbi:MULTISPECIES: hypothetical protein [Argonema]|uniref:hypothetical protein n=1 Tax=Argonema TaxID=2942761 RepID=UPI0020121E6F|nr:MULTISPECIES: hypothetical protein [Argonema]MCL1466202.1 hypothetical protein [Argonema galeatum A003/A1]
MMTLQEIMNHIEVLPVEDREQLFEFLRKKHEDARGTAFWEGLQKFRKTIEDEGIIFNDDDFSDLRDRSVGREVNL